MNKQNRVVSLRARGGGQGISLPPSLMRLRDSSGQTFSAVLSEFFDNADDALFNMADKAGNNKDQTAYFEAMRELRLRRKSMSLSMLQWVSRAFNEIGTFDPRPGSENLTQVDQDSLSLVGHGDHEQQVAIDNLISKLRTGYNKAIGMLVARTQHLMPELNLKDRQMPLSPEVICCGLQQACDDLDIDIRARIVVLKLFDKLLIDKLEAFYQDANKLLVNEGVLPEMTRPPSVRSQTPKPSQASAASVEGEALGAETGEATFTELSELLHQSPRNGAQGMPARGAQTQGITVDRSELMACLAELQGRGAHSGFPETGFDGGSGGSGGESAVGFSSLTAQVESALQQHAKGLGSLKQVDADVLNLVTMLFDFILEDRQLPSAMKALIGRLQIPILKVAMLDRSFFNRGGHPARKLLNELATAGIGWNPKAEGQRDPLRDKIESVVDRLLNEFTDNVSIFQEVLADFAHFVDIDRRRRELVEQRLRDAEEGRAKQERARVVASEILVPLQSGRELPEPVPQLLEEPWSRYLQFLYLREGESSDAWRRAVNTAEKLVWSVDPQPVTPETRTELLRELPVVVDELRRGLHSISWDPFASDRLIRDLELTHVDTLQRLALKAPVTPETPLSGDRAAGLSGANTGQTSVITEAPDSPDAGEAELAAPLLTGREPVVAPVSKGVQNPDTAPEMPLPAVPAQELSSTSAPTGERVAEPQPLSQTQSHWHDSAEKLRVGSWVEVISDSQKMRCKLAAVIKATGKYIFVNRNGAKIAEYDLDQVAAAMESGELALLDDGLIFDRALESIIDNLRHSRRD